MRLNYIYQNFKFAGIFILCLLLTGVVNAQAQKEKKRQMVDVTLKIVDETGAPLPGASVIVGEGVIHTATDANGSAVFKGYADDIVSISMKGYDKRSIIVAEAIKQPSLTLIKGKLFMTAEDNVLLPFISLKKRTLSGSTGVIAGDQLDNYPSTDLRNAFTGLAGIEVRENYGAPGISAQEYLGSFRAVEKINVSARGRSLSFMVDNVYTDITEYPLDPNEIESVSVIKDIAGKAMFGPVGADGIVYITTKRGSKNERLLSANFEQGVGLIDRMPGWVSGGDYARLNNEARTNSGTTPLYTEADIAAYDLNNAWDAVHPSINFRDMMLKDYRPFTRANVSSKGGNDVIQYFAYLGYNGEGDIYRMGSTANYSRITTRSNIDIKVNDNFGIGFDFYGNIGIRKSPNYGYSSNFTSENSSSNPVLGLIELPDVLDHITSTPPVAFPIYANVDENGTPWYGVTTAYPINPIGNLVGNGYYTDQGRQGAANVNLNYNMQRFIPGLKSKTFLGFNTYNLVRIGKAEDYIAYKATPTSTPEGLAEPVTLEKVHLGVDQANNAKLMDYYFQKYVVYENLTYEKSFSNSNLTASGTYYLAKTFKNDIEEPERQQNGILTAVYSIKDKYALTGVLNYSGTYSFSKENRYRLFPSIGASWVVSDENFMKGLKVIDYLKLRAEYGTLGVENFMSPYRYRDNWSTNNSGSSFGAASSNQWFGGSTDASVQRAYPSRIGNPDLTWELSKEVSAGFDALLMKGKINLEVTYFNTVREGSIVQLNNSLPFTLGLTGARPYANYNDTRYFGVESILHFSDEAGGFKYTIGGSATIQNSERLKVDEPEYRYSYMSVVGKPVDAIYGLTYLGRFSSDDETLVVPQLFDEVLHKDDLKYSDLNGDGMVDENDRSQIGHASPRLIYTVDANIRFRRFEMSVMGTGRAFYNVTLTNSYFMNGWGNDNYSNFVKDNIGGDYPRLTYYRINNNFQFSNYWMRKGDFFKIQYVELGYNLPESITNIIGSRGIKIYARGANVLTFSNIKDVDPEAMSSGITNYPLYKTFTGGIKLIF